MTNKEKYKQFCEKVYVPIYSQTWWLDAVCTPDRWDVWLYESNNVVLAAMPYYFEKRGDYSYITKAPLTQNNGIIFSYPNGISEIGKAAHEEKIINEMNEFIETKSIDIYEQQYHHSFKNYLPFFWNGYEAIPRYTYIIDKNISLECAWENISSNQRKHIRKGKKSGYYSEDISKELFYKEHEKIFLKQGLTCPFSYDLWDRLYESVKAHNQGKMACYKDINKNILSLIFWVWDENSVYQLLGGGMPQYLSSNTYASLIWDGVGMAKEKGKAYDFEGSMIKRISKSFREYGGVPEQYFRIRKVFNKDILMEECRRQCEKLENK